MKPSKNIDYTAMTALCHKLGIVPFENRGEYKAGVYTLKGYHAPIDLSACALNEMAILKTALNQLSQEADEAWRLQIERNFKGNED